MAKKNIQDVVDQVVTAVRSNTRGGTGNGFVRNSGNYYSQPGVGSQNQYGTSYVQLIQQIYDMINSGASFEDILKQMSVQGDAMNGGQVDDLNKQLLDQALNLASLNEDRAYNVQLRDEQRLYDNPLNQLARLMGAGISRDAAIQMLSGGSGSGGAGIPYSDPAAPAASAIPATQSTLNNAQTAQAYANIAMQGTFGTIQAVSGLVSLGFSSAQAFQQIGVAKNQKYLTDQQRKAYDAASGAFTVLNSAGVENAAEVFGSIDSTVKSVQALADAGNTAAKSFIDSGGVQLLRQTAPYSAPFLNQLYKNERDSSDYAALMSKQFRAMDLQNGLSEVSIDKGHVEVEQMYKQLLIQDEQLALLNQQLRKGEVDIKIAGETLNAAKYQNVYGKIQSEAYESAMENGLDGSVSGKQMLSEATWRELYGHWRKLGVEQSEDNYAAYEKYLQNNFEAACFVATIKAATTKQLSDIWTNDPEHPENDNTAAKVWNRFTNVFFGTKTDQIVNLGAQAAEIGATLYLGTHNKNFIP